MMNYSDNEGFAVISYALDRERSSDGTIYRADLLVQSRRRRDDDALMELLQRDPRILVERIS